jgi:hypothetical protein
MFENRVHEDRFLLSSSCVQGSSAIEYARTTPRSQLSPAETGILSHLYIKTIILPRQARDKHRENSKKDAVFPTGDRCLLRVALLPGHHRIRLTHINTQPKPAGAHTHGGRHTQRRTRQRQPSAARRKEKSPDNEPKKKKALARCQRSSPSALSAHLYLRSLVD